MIADIGIGILLAFFGHHVLDVALTPSLFMWSIVFSLLPDIDMIMYLIPGFKKVFKQHRGWTHYPLVYIPIILIVYIFIGPAWAIIMALGVSIHLVHDLLWIGHGVKFWWPFYHKYYKFFSQEKYTKPGEHWITTFYFRLNPVTIIEYGIFVLALVILLINI